MPVFRNPVDIANRAIQHCGARQINLSLGFTEDSKNSRETRAVYDKLRATELTRTVWRFAIKHAPLRAIATTSRELLAAMWSSTAVYFRGSIVSDEQNRIWISSLDSNRGNEPGNSDFWDLYFGPLAVLPWDSTDSYHAGEVVYITAGDGTYTVYLNMLQGNQNNPATVPAWSATTTYMPGSLVVSAAVNYQSLIDFNLNQVPSATNAPAAWDATVTYGAGQRVRGSDGFMYTSVGNGNLGNDPTLTAPTLWTKLTLAIWTSVLTRTASGDGWQVLDNAILRPFSLPLPISVGPTGAASARNVYRLPSNYLKVAPQDPKQGASSYLGAPTGAYYKDWLFEGDFIVSRQPTIILLRFVGDMTDVRRFDNGFCEGLAWEIALAISPSITASTEKRKEVAAGYKQFMTEYRNVTAIEQGPVEPEEDDYIATRR